MRVVVNKIFVRTKKFISFWNYYPYMLYYFEKTNFQLYDIYRKLGRFNYAKIFSAYGVEDTEEETSCEELQWKYRL